MSQRNEEHQAAGGGVLGQLEDVSGVSAVSDVRSAGGQLQRRRISGQLLRGGVHVGAECSVTGAAEQKGQQLAAVTDGCTAG